MPIGERLPPLGPRNIFATSGVSGPAVVKRPATSGEAPATRRKAGSHSWTSDQRIHRATTMRRRARRARRPSTMATHLPFRRHGIAQLRQTPAVRPYLRGLSRGKRWCGQMHRDVCVRFQRFDRTIPTAEMGPAAERQLIPISATTGRQYGPFFVFVTLI